ncbi:MAG: aspartate/glutamate racemase family protein [Candidatus Hodarchaeales archaeon]
MRTIGLIGGISWESTLEYYKLMNEYVKTLLGGYHSAQCLLYSVNFNEIHSLQNNDDWDKIASIMIQISKKLEEAGADLLLIASNTIHKIADKVENSINIPFVNIIDEIGKEITNMGLKNVGLLGTKFTMTEDFYRGRLSKKFNISTHIPDENDITEIQDIIFNELVFGQFKSESRLKFIEIIQKLISEGSEGIILGCTEIPLLLQGTKVNIPIFDTTTIHAKAAVDFALKGVTV